MEGSLGWSSQHGLDRPAFRSDLEEGWDRMMAFWDTAAVDLRSSYSANGLS